MTGFHPGVLVAPRRVYVFCPGPFGPRGSGPGGPTIPPGFFDHGRLAAKKPQTGLLCPKKRVYFSPPGPGPFLPPGVGEKGGFFNVYVLPKGPPPPGVSDGGLGPKKAFTFSPKGPLFPGLF